MGNAKETVRLNGRCCLTGLCSTVTFALLKFDPLNPLSRSPALPLSRSPALPLSRFPRSLSVLPRTLSIQVDVGRCMRANPSVSPRNSVGQI